MPGAVPKSRREKEVKRTEPLWCCQSQPPSLAEQRACENQACHRRQSTRTQKRACQKMELNARRRAKDSTAVGTAAPNTASTFCPEGKGANSRENIVGRGRRRRRRRNREEEEEEEEELHL
ncbi:unnamed protein product [Prorocentrum cordatum]|uniref:Uncharacterized protein n=1 Tax=Prorocentrum cordatum TaxID=2364126 RepID=A0ABN9QRM6_9DINO|nr:unnamed protein product [Polarella glacialis]